MSCGTLDTASVFPMSLTGLSPCFAALPRAFSYLSHYMSQSLPRPNCFDRFGLFRVRSPLLAESLLMSFPRPTEMFQFRRFPSHTYLIQYEIHELHSYGFPHSEISGSMRICRSPKLIAACHVLHRLLVPRHSPCALYSLTSCKT